uniref:Uncharacterized protein n=1 Tax=Siphoviridae sp. ctlHU7 TaxID=2827588 RepID=A0A8S5LIG6_9CAUD|nr:MAG TPA: hypothetical protein [Siphoviridae sp. ctlHU7]DAI79075.1 MAG TPA: hypothetical protein [Caudoviricetes sp.]DAQ66605.1 MAG TPA: hypothetical protein [Caudoviricetes sp.]DAR80045.1 MAG TPA: hypothetical protein [Caudoviricetes sp.]
MVCPPLVSLCIFTIISPVISLSSGGTWKQH